MSEPTTAVQRSSQQQVQQVQDLKGEITFTPLAAADPIKLSIAIVQKWCCKPTKSGAVCTESDAMRFMMLCRARRLNPFENDAYLVGYDGRNGPEFSLITAHQAFLKRAEPQPSFNGIDSGIIVSPGWQCKACDEGFVNQGDGGFERCPICHGSSTRDEVQGDLIPEGQKLIGGWAHLERSDRKIPTHRRLALAAFKPNYPTPFWETDAKAAGQMCKCAEADCLRSAYPTLVGGLYNDSESGFAMVVKDGGGNLSAALSAPSPAPAPAKRLSAPAPLAANGGRPKPTLVEEPLTPDEKAEADAGLAPEAPKQTQPKDGLSDAQRQVAQIVSDAGGDFDTFRAWGAEQYGAGDKTIGILSWDSMSGFSDVPEKVAKLILRVGGELEKALKGGAQ